MREVTVSERWSLNALALGAVIFILFVISVPLIEYVHHEREQEKLRLKRQQEVRDSLQNQFRTNHTNKI